MKTMALCSLQHSEATLTSFTGIDIGNTTIVVVFSSPFFI